MSDQFISEMCFDEGFMHALAQPRLSKLVEGAREGGFRRQFLAQLKTTEASQHPVYCQALNQP